jgi:hypothetical protein
VGAGDVSRNGRDRDTSPTEEHEAFIHAHNQRMRRVDQALENLQKLTRKARRRREKQASGR